MQLDFSCACMQRNCVCTCQTSSPAPRCSQTLPHHDDVARSQCSIPARCSATGPSRHSTRHPVNTSVSWCSVLHSSMKGTVLQRQALPSRHTCSVPREQPGRPAPRRQGAAQSAGVQIVTRLDGAHEQFAGCDHCKVDLPAEARFMLVQHRQGPCSASQTRPASVHGCLRRRQSAWRPVAQWLRRRVRPRCPPEQPCTAGNACSPCNISAHTMFEQHLCSHGFRSKPDTAVMHATAAPSTDALPHDDVPFVAREGIRNIAM
jgi:hypothetical protein